MTLLVLGLALVSFAVAGLAVDGTRAFLLRRTLQNAADSSALAGAAELDQQVYYESEGRHVVLDPDSAERVALEWLARRGVDATVAVYADTGKVRVALQDDLPTTFLGLVGVLKIPVGVVATAAPVSGP